MKVQTAKIEADVRGEKYMVEVEAEVCTRCGEALLDDAQADAYTIAGGTPTAAPMVSSPPLKSKPPASVWACRRRTSPTA